MLNKFGLELGVLEVCHCISTIAVAHLRLKSARMYREVPLLFGWRGAKNCGDE